MVAIDMDMPSCCVTYTSENDNYTSCPFYKICKQRETIKTNYKPNDCPLVEIEERKQGKWIYSGSYDVEGMLYCSNCKHEIDVSEGYFNYCPNCGADMRGKNKYDCVKCRHDGFICDECINGSKYEK